MMRYLLLLVTLCFTLWILAVNVGVHRAPRVGSVHEREEVLAQLRYLGPRMHADLGADMQRLFPEGEVFADVLYGLAWCGLAERAGTGDTIREHALREARWALACMERPHVQAPFASADGLPFGAFYHGWRAHLIGAIARLDRADSAMQRRWNIECDHLAEAFAAAASPYLPSYPGMAWPADNVVAMAAVASNDRHRAGVHRGTIARWLGQVRARVDAHGRVPHAWDPVRDAVHQTVRGSSTVLMGAFWPAIDSAFAAEQFVRFRADLLTERFGVPVVREHPKGEAGAGDVDSGPVILGAGSSATVVGTAACRANGDLFHAQELDATCEGFGLAMGGARKRYLLGAMPMADLFLAWGRSRPVPLEATNSPRFLRWHAWSALALVLVWAPWWWPWFRRAKWAQR